MPVLSPAPRTSRLARAARRAPWWTALGAAIAVGAAVLLIDLVNQSTPWRADVREAWSLGILVLFISGGMGSLVAATAPPENEAQAVAALARDWARRRPLRFGAAVGLCCGAAVALSDLDLWHVAPGPALVHAAVLAVLVALIGPVHLLTSDARRALRG